MADTLKWEELPITNNFIFLKVMQNKELCRRFLETILKIEIDHLENVVTESALSENPNSKFVRFDVHVKNSDRTFIIEMQVVNTNELPQRARFYQSISDVADLNAGDDYLNLPENIVIFLCPFDIYTKGYPIYTFRNLCLEDKTIEMGDMTEKIFINFHFYDKIEDEEIRNLMMFFSKGETEGELSQKFSKALQIARKNLEWKREWMEINFALWDAKKLARAEGVAEGRAEGRAEGEAAAKAELQPIIEQQEKQISAKDAEIEALKKQMQKLLDQKNYKLKKS